MSPAATCVQGLCAFPDLEDRAGRWRHRGCLEGMSRHASHFHLIFGPAYDASYSTSNGMGRRAFLGSGSSCCNCQPAAAAACCCTCLPYRHQPSANSMSALSSSRPRSSRYWLLKGGSVVVGPDRQFRSAHAVASDQLQECRKASGTGARVAGPCILQMSNGTPQLLLC
jgi:hypothetical protein